MSAPKWSVQHTGGGCLWKICYFRSRTDGQKYALAATDGEAQVPHIGGPILLGLYKVLDRDLYDDENGRLIASAGDMAEEPDFNWWSPFFYGNWDQVAAEVQAALGREDRCPFGFHDLIGSWEEFDKVLEATQGGIP